jgi:lipopolysaccharide/colanic/teichoic acid biosynthesis glycosyltransferase
MDGTRLSHWTIPEIPLTVRRSRHLYFCCKRLVDLVLTVLLLVVLCPLMVVIAISIKLDTPGPVIFAQERVGARRRSERGQVTWQIRNFTVYKFRSMVADVDQSLHQEYIRAFVQGRVEAAAVDGARFKLANDPRVTRMGRILRGTSLDELPQLVNVLKGEMSLVGPRPVPTYEFAEYQEADTCRLAALPGITGLWQVQGRADVSFVEMIRMDREYVRNQSLWLDLKILVATIPVVICGRGAR